MEILGIVVIAFFVLVVVMHEKNEGIKREEKETTFELWRKELIEKFNTNMKYYKQCNEKGVIVKIASMPYNLRRIKQEIETLEVCYGAAYDEHLKDYQKLMREKAMEIMSKKGRYYILSSLNAFILLKDSYNGDIRFDAAIRALNEMLEESVKVVNYITEEAYGRINVPILDNNDWEEGDKKAIEVETKIRYLHNSDKNLLNENVINRISQNLNGELIKEISALMWYYAVRKPFDPNKFANAELAFERYTAHKYDNKVIPKVENLLADIYAKNQIGGIGIVRAEIPYIMSWLEVKIAFREVKSCCVLASGLAWMDLYELEREVLRKLVVAGMKLPEEVQERLSFLESGGTSDVRIYSDIPTDKFIFDSSATEWKGSEFDVFFHKLAMKKMKLNYSLAVDKWTKTLPLASGQKVDSEKMYAEFNGMIEDFDGEVTCEKVMAQAINLENVEYEDAVLFKFASKRNRCLSMLFSSEKYGKNLNITIITLFTPENGIEYEELKKYALAINENMYVDSFKESILQSVDTVLQVKKTVYEEQEVKKNIFE